MIFVSHKKSLKVILDPKRKKIANDGSVVVTEGMSVRFSNGIFETEDEAVIKAMKASRMFGIYYKAGDKSEEEEQSDASKRFAADKKSVTKNTLTSCPFCSFNGKDVSELKVHMKKKLGEGDHPTEMPDILK